jgi:hypothetical protein
VVLCGRFSAAPDSANVTPADVPNANWLRRVAVSAGAAKASEPAAGQTHLDCKYLPAPIWMVDLCYSAHREETP